MRSNGGMEMFDLDAFDLDPLLSVRQTAAVLGIGQTKLFDLLRDREIASVKVGSLRKIPVSSVKAYVASLKEESASVDDVRI